MRRKGNLLKGTIPCMFELRRLHFKKSKQKYIEATSLLCAEFTPKKKCRRCLIFQFVAAIDDRVH